MREKTSRNNSLTFCDENPTSRVASKIDIPPLPLCACYTYVCDRGKRSRKTQSAEDSSETRHSTDDCSNFVFGAAVLSGTAIYYYSGPRHILLRLYLYSRTCFYKYVVGTLIF